MNAAHSQRQIGGLDMATVRSQLQRWPAVVAPISRYEYGQRLHRARLLMRELGVDALLITAGASLRYFTGIAWGASERLVALLVTARGTPIMICPAFETGSLQYVLRIEADVRLWEEHESPYALVAQALRERLAGNLALDPAATHAVATQLVAALGERRLTDASAIVDGCRMRKSVAELALMQQATAMTLQVQRLAASVLHEDISNHALVRFIDEAHRALGADGGSTFCIVQFGQATAFPHGIPGEQRLARDDLVLIDTGCTVQSYDSDMPLLRVWPSGRSAGGDLAARTRRAARRVRSGAPRRELRNRGRGRARGGRARRPGPGLSPARHSAPHRSRLRPRHPRSAIPGPWQRHRAAIGHVLQRRADDRGAGPFRHPAGGPLPRHRRRCGMVHRTLARVRPAVRMSLADRRTPVG
jgi:Xaa-Pro dipeptidase